MKTVSRRRWTRFLPLTVFGFSLVLIVMLGGEINAQKESLEQKKKNTLKKEDPGVNVVALPLKKQTMIDRIDLPAELTAWLSVDIKAEIQGKVVEKSFEEGDYVEKGQRLLKLDHRDYENQVRSSQAAYNLAQYNRDKLQSLYQNKIVDRSALETAIAEVDRAKALLGNAELNLERTQITALFSGYISESSVEKGQYLRVADPVFKLVRLDQVKVRLGIPESEVAKVNLAEGFHVFVTAIGKTYAAKRHSLSRVAASQAKLFELVLALPNENQELYPGMFARATVIKKTLPDRIAVPLFSILNEDDRQYVHVAVEDENQKMIVKKRYVKTGIQDGWLMEIVSGLSEKDLLIVVGHRDVAEGQPVTIVQRVESIEELLH